jgi:hypothetical protein
LALPALASGVSVSQDVTIILPSNASEYLLGEYEINTNSAESFFSRMRRGEIGHHHHLAGPYLIRFAQEMAWREDHRRDPNGSQVDRVVALVMKNKPSVDFCGYWQRSCTL